MIYWSRYFPRWKYPGGFAKLLKAYLLYLDHPVIDLEDPMIFRCLNLKGKQGKLAELRDKHKGERCFIIANGPSLSKVDMRLLKDEVTIGCNGIYKEFDKWGYSTDYLVVEDVEQTEIRGSELSQVKGPTKLAALHNAHALAFFNDFLFFDVPKTRYHHDYYFEEPLYPQFSHDFASTVHLGYTVTYIMLQLAYHLGFSQIYLLGLDHSYGRLPDLFPPGKLKITEENYPLVQECHFDKSYYQVGDVIGIPWSKKQEAAYRLARTVLEENGVEIKNLTDGSKLEVFDKASLSEIAF